MTIMPYKKLSAASLVLTPLLIASTGWSNTISVGGTQLVIPDPPGFAAVTAQMPTVYRLRQQQVAPGNEQFICFIPELDIPNAMKDGLPRSARWFSVQTPKETVGISFSKTNFSELTQVLRTQIDELCGQVEKEAPGLLERVNKGLTKEFGVDLGSVSQMVPLTPHEETGHTFAWSMFVKREHRGTTGNSAFSVDVCTTTFVNVREKLLILYCYAEEAGLAWSRTVSKHWVDSVVAANLTHTLTAPEKPLSPTTIRIAKGIGTVVIMAVIGGLVGLGKMAWRRSGSSKDDTRQDPANPEGE